VSPWSVIGVAVRSTIAATSPLRSSSTETHRDMAPRHTEELERQELFQSFCS
jgi:hypothetical protein